MTDYKPGDFQARINKSMPMLKQQWMGTSQPMPEQPPVPQKPSIEQQVEAVEKSGRKELPPDVAVKAQAIPTIGAATNGQQPVPTKNPDAMNKAMQGPEGWGGKK